MRKAMLLVGVCLFLVSSSAASAARVETRFHAGRTARPLAVDREHVVVQAAEGDAIVAAKGVSAAATAAFAQMGLAVTPRAAVKTADAIVGYPVWFDVAKDAIGVLTHEIVVRLEPGAKVELVRRVPGFADVRPAGFGQDLYLARFTSPMAALDGANALYKQKGVLYAHPNFLKPKVWRSAKAPRGPADEPLFDVQWHLSNAGQTGGTRGADIGVKGAWDVTTGSEDVLVAVLDGGFEVTHPDLDGAFWRNAGEIPGNGVDDDGNGYVDDVQGWNYWARSDDVARGPVADHGTAVAGLVGARLNGRGMIGVCPRCRMLPIVVAWSVADDAAAFHYAGKAGAHIITNSWGYAVGTPETDVVVDAIRTTAATGRDGKGAIILFAMNNIDQDDCIGSTPDISALPSVIAVSAASDLDKKVSFSAWGACMEFLSPSYEMGRAGIGTTDLTGQRGYNNGRRPNDLRDTDYTNDFGGTSAATPIAAGVFGLMLSVNEDLTRDEALALVISTADKVHPDLARYDARSGFSTKYGYGRINAERAVRAAQVFRKYTKKDASRAPGRTVRQ